MICIFLIKLHIFLIIDIVQILRNNFQPSPTNDHKYAYFSLFIIIITPGTILII